MRLPEGIPALLILLSITHAAWAADYIAWRENGVIVCADPSQQSGLALQRLSNGFGLVLWQDERDHLPSIYFQIMDAAGRRQYAANGQNMFPNQLYAQSPRFVATGLEWYALWQNPQNYQSIRANLFNETVVPQWPGSGVELTTTASNPSRFQGSAQIHSGLWAVWEDAVNITSTDIYANRFASNGQALFGTAGVAVCNATGEQLFPQVAALSNGGALMAWQDYRSDPDEADIYFQHYSAGGSPLLADNGAGLCTASGNQEEVHVCAAAWPGALVAWLDQRSGSNPDYYFQMFSAGGNTLNAAGGVPLSAAVGLQDQLAWTEDGTGGFFFAWRDSRDTARPRIYGQHVLASGAFDFTTLGLLLAPDTIDQKNPALWADGSGGFYIAWAQNHATQGFNIHLNRFDQDGQGAWSTHSQGIVVCSALGDQTNPALTAGPNGGVYVAWLDRRDGQKDDIYLAAVAADSAIGMGKAFDVQPEDQKVQAFPNPARDRVRIIWEETRAVSAEVDFFNFALQKISHAGLTSPGLFLDWSCENIPSGMYFYRLTLTLEGGQRVELPMKKLWIRK